MGKIALYFVIIVIAMGILGDACDLDQMRHGCRIFNNQCSCGYGCRAEYRYDSNESCKMALKGRRHDICSRQRPCLHDGSCLQISQEPGYKCQCEGTGYYGARCDRPCPGPNSLKFRGPFPYECVVI
ncbi:multiple epidermal growth factor-like domains protein 10 [Diachasma alloeum]|uniref:multiple epidermal growth factor-like domains protein 10 n=1 Tax=Diachasma alloeum TaxID=454923 RepID=UPI0007384CB1|nr:multiple epidermal growth factor-like domains protein 10 [Diachasma alloeum]